MALPVWALYMKKCYEDESLDISTEAFKKPSKLSIVTDCSKWKDDKGDVEEIPDELDF